MLQGELKGITGEAADRLRCDVSASGAINGSLRSESKCRADDALRGAISALTISGEAWSKAVKASDELQGNVSASIEPVENYPLAYEGSYEVDPLKREQILPTMSRVMLRDLKVHGIYYYEVTNGKGGKTVTIGRD